MTNQPDSQEPRKKNKEGENTGQSPGTEPARASGASLAGAFAAGAAGNLGAEYVKDLFTDSPSTESATPLSGVATSTAGAATSEQAKEDGSGLASAVSQHIVDVTEDNIPEPTPQPVSHQPAREPELPFAEPEILEPVVQQTPSSPELNPESPLPYSGPDPAPETPSPQSAESLEFGGHRMELDGNDDGKMDQVLWDVNQDSFVDVIGTDANQDSIITSDEVKIINDPATLQKPEEVADPSVLFLDVNHDNNPEVMLMDTNTDQKADDVLPLIDYSGEVASDIPDDVDPSAENQHREDLSKLDDPFSDLNQWA